MYCGLTVPFIALDAPPFHGIMAIDTNTNEKYSAIYVLVMGGFIWVIVFIIAMYMTIQLLIHARRVARGRLIGYIAA